EGRGVVRSARHWAWLWSFVVLRGRDGLLLYQLAVLWQRPDRILTPLALTLNAMRCGAQALLFARQGKGRPSRARLGQPDGDGLLRRPRRRARDRRSRRPPP